MFLLQDALDAIKYLGADFVFWALIAFQAIAIGGLCFHLVKGGYYAHFHLDISLEATRVARRVQWFHEVPAPVPQQQPQAQQQAQPQAGQEGPQQNFPQG